MLLMAVKERLIRFIKYEGIPIRRFEARTGLSFGYVNAIRVSIQPDKISSIAREFPNLNTGWLLTGDGDMLKSGMDSSVSKMLGCRKIHNILFFQWGKVYVIDSHSQGQLIKRICEHDDPEMITLVSDNKEKYPPFAIPKSDIRSLSIVVGVVRME